MSQSFADTAGATYSVTFWALNTDGSHDPTDILTLAAANGVINLDQSVPNTWTPYSFSFTGTGSDTLSIGAFNTPAEYYADDISIDPVSAPGPVAGAGSACLAFLVLAGALTRARGVSAG